ncbi:MAG: hypothetical protein JWM46_643 [Candidatus Kaiserbacteria bacterium]|nr:hypothetical protein [Candidatus Kaiserbacteria bacterium]
MNSDRAVQLVLTLVIAAALLGVGDTLHMKVVEQPSTGYAVILPTLFAAMLAVVGFIIAFDKSGDRRTPIIAMGTWTLCVLCFAVVAAPITNFGWQPWQWHTAWSIIPIIGAVPLVFVIKNLIPRWSLVSYTEEPIYYPAW